MNAQKLVKQGSMAPVWNGREMPRHIQIAYGRHIFRLMHGTPEQNKRRGIWLRDLPLNLSDLAREYGYFDAVSAYHAECDRIKLNYDYRYA